MKGQEDLDTQREETQIQWEERGRDPLEGRRWAALKGKEVRKDKEKQRDQRNMLL